MYNKSQLSRDKKNAKKQVSMPNPFGKDVDYVSQMGYRDDSPFKDRPYIDINTPNGTIDMSNTGVDLIANGRFLPKYSGTHQFDTNVVREERIAEEGGEYLELDEDQIAAYRAGGYVVEELPQAQKGLNWKNRIRKVYNREIASPTNDELAQFLNPEYQRITQGQEVTVRPRKTGETREDIQNTMSNILTENEKVKNYYKEYEQSPRYREMLKQADPKKYENLWNARHMNLYGRPFEEYNFPNVNTSLPKINESFTAKEPSVTYRVNQPKDNPYVGGISSGNGDIYIFPNGIGVKGLLPHEWSHSIDRPSNNYIEGYIGDLIPIRDQNFMKKSKPKNFYQSPEWKSISAEDRDNYLQNNNNPEIKEWLQEMHDYIDYVAAPSETRARLNNIRYESKQRGIYDPFTQKVTPEIFDNILKTKFETGKKEEFDALKQLKDVYTDEQIQWMLNNISKNDNQSTDINQAKSGGVYSQDIPYPPKHNPANSFAVNDPRSMQPGGGVKYTVDPNDPNIHIYSDKYAYNLAKKEENNAWAAYNYYRNNMTPPAFTYDERNWAGMRTGNKVKPKPSDKDVKHVPASVGHSMVRNQYTWQGIQNNNDPMDDYDYKCYEGDPRCNEKGLLPEFRGIKPSGYDVIDWTYPTGNKSRAVVSVFDKPKIKNIYKEPAEPTPPSKGQKSPQTTAKVKTSNESKPSTEFDERWENNTPQMVKVDYPTNYSKKSQHLDENGNIVTETIYYDVPKNANESLSITPPPINDDLEFEPPVEAQSTNPDPLNDVEPAKKYPKAYIPNYRTGVWSATGRVNPEQKKRKARTINLEEEYGDKYKSFAQGGSIMDLNLTEEEIEQYRRGGYIVEELPTAQYGKNFTRTYDPLLDYKPQVSESTKPKTVATIDKNVLKKEVVKKTEERKKVAEVVKKSPMLTDKQKTEILMSPQKLDENAHLAYQKEPDIIKQVEAPSTTERIWDIATNPQAAFEYAVRTGDFRNMPYNYNDMLMAGIDPSAGKGANLVGDALNASYNLLDAGDKVVRNIGEGNYGTAAMQGLRFLPGSRLSTGLGKKLETAYDKVATGNSLLTDFGLPAWKVERPTNNSLYPGLSRPYIAKTVTDQEAELLNKFGRGMRFDSQEEWDAMEALTKSGATDFSKSDTPISRVLGYYERGSDEQKAIEALRRGDVFATPTEKNIRTWSAGVPEVDDYLEGKTRLIIPSRYTKNLGSHFSAMPYDDVRVGFIHEDKINGIQPYLNVNAILENELMGNIPEGFKVIGRNSEDGLNNLIIKPIKNSGSLSNYLTTQTPLKNTYKINPLANRLGEYNRVVGQDAVDDIVESGLVRVNENAGVAQDFGPFGTVYRQTPYPSFAKAAPQKTYAEQVISEGKTPYIISTDRPMRASTLGRHGKGKTQFPVDEAGKYMTGFPASEAKVYEFGDPHWLKGYKEVPVELPGLPNTFTRSGLGGMDMSNHVIKNVDYYTQLLNTYNSKALPAANRKFYKDLIANVKKQDGLVTERQLNELKRLATGNFDFGSKGYNKGYEEGGSYVDNQMTHFQPGGSIPYNYNPLVSNEPEGVEIPMSFNPKRTTNDPEDYQQFLDYSTTAPENRRPYEDYFYGNPNEYDHYGMWDALGKPKDFEEALKMNPWWEPDPYDKMYHGFSVNPNTGVFLKAGKPGESKPGDTTWMEVAGHYLSPRAQVDTPVFDTDLQRFRYIPNQQDGGNTDPGNNALELHMFYDKDVYKKQKGGNTFQPGQIYTYDENPGVFYKLDNSGNIVVKNKEAGSNEYVAIKDPKGTRRKTLEYGLNTGSTNLYGTPEQYAEYSNKGSAINDFFFSENEAAKQLHQSNAEQCLKDSPNCLSSTWLYYDRHLAPNLGLPSSWQLKENAGIYSGPKEKNSAFPKYGESADSWDIARAIIEGQGKSYYAAKDDAGAAYPTKKFWKDLNLPVGAIINAGSKGGGLKYGKGDTYNEGAGLVPSNHSAMVVGYDAEGIPYIYDYGKIVKATDPNALINGMGITNITAPKELTGQTYANLKKQNKLKDEITDLKFNISDDSYNQISDIDEYKPFIKNLESNKSEIMSALGISNKTYDEYAKRAAAIALTETGGGNDASIRWTYANYPVPSYITDKIGFGSSQGITQINTDVLFSSDKTKKQMNTLGITKDNYDPYNSKHIAAATMIMLADADKVAMANLKKHSSNKQDLNPAAATYYQWNSPSALVKGEAQGDNINVKRFMQNYNMINNTFKKDGGAVEYLTQKQIDELRAKGYHVVEE